MRNMLPAALFLFGLPGMVDDYHSWTDVLGMSLPPGMGTAIVGTAIGWWVVSLFYRKKQRDSVEDQLAEQGQAISAQKQTISEQNQRILALEAQGAGRGDIGSVTIENVSVSKPSQPTQPDPVRVASITVEEVSDETFPKEEPTASTERRET